MTPNDPSLFDWLRESLREYFPGQALNVRAKGIDTLIVDVTDPSGQPRELTFSVEELQRRKASAKRSSDIVRFPGP